MAEYSSPTVNAGLELRSFSSVVSAQVKEYGPTPLALPSNPHAQINSVIPLPSDILSTTEVQQSSKMSVSLFAISSDLWMPLHITRGLFLFFFSGSLDVARSAQNSEEGFVLCVRRPFQFFRS